MRNQLAKTRKDQRSVQKVQRDVTRIIEDTARAINIDLPTDII